MLSMRFVYSTCINYKILLLQPTYPCGKPVPSYPRIFISFSISPKTLGEIEEILKRDFDIATFICEPILDNGGFITPPDGYFKEISTLLKKYGVLLICERKSNSLQFCAMIIKLINFC